MSDPLASRLKIMIVDTLNLRDVVAGEIPDDEPLLGSPRLGLDSLDALELVVRLEKEFGVRIGSSEESRRALTSVSALSAFIRSHQAPA
ncbi:MAG: phosphopantetheine-binding protein [Opitutaceae bacterium]|nr:phosphopantetheine-binding protein [Opitutaceae bacterium]